MWYKCSFVVQKNAEILTFLSNILIDEWPFYYLKLLWLIKDNRLESWTEKQTQKDIPHEYIAKTQIFRCFIPKKISVKVFPLCKYYKSVMCLGLMCTKFLYRM